MGSLNAHQIHWYANLLIVSVNRTESRRSLGTVPEEHAEFISRQGNTLYGDLDPVIKNLLSTQLHICALLQLKFSQPIGGTNFRDSDIVSEYTLRPAIVSVTNSPSLW